MRRRLAALGTVLILASAAARAKDPEIILSWPADKPIIKFTLGRFVQTGSMHKQNTYTVEVTAENLWGKRITGISFDVYLFDKNKVRIGDGFLQVNNLDPGQKTKFSMFVQSIGTPASLSLQPQRVPDELQGPRPAKTVPIRVYSVPSGANFKVDGQDAGTTPKLYKFTVGQHTLEFSKEGFATGTTTFEVGPDEIGGGAVTFELGGLSKDTIELRDGTVLTGDLVSLDATSVVVRIAGKDQKLDRNQVKRILLVEREIVKQ